MKRRFSFGVGERTTSTNSLQKGFTIVELMIATMVFSVILLVVTTGMIKIGNIYYKGIISGKTQDVVRDVMNELSSAVQFSLNDPNPIPTNTVSGQINQFCMGDIRYTTYLNSRFTIGNEFNSGLVAAKMSPTATGCSDNSAGAVLEQRQLLGNNMRVLVLTMSNPSDSLWAIDLKIAYGDNDLLSNDDNPSALLSDVTCKLGSGSSFCATAKLDTVVNKRIK